ncbi:hypothetical protein GCM10010406_14940 [Streptomyces thermolineatus]|uniref:DUF7144 domain-containing protein n=1 Tax=Streptomyces thermolineatus TaxID=44033 RepID=A0ABN3LBE0_9ACTN
MTSHVSGAGARAGAASRTATTGGVTGGRVAFAATVMVIGGLMHLLAGIAAISNDSVFVTSGETANYVYAFNLTGWGWAHVILGVFVAVVGFALFSGATWAVYTGVALAGLAAIADFLWLPYTPVWATVLMALNIFIIWALVTGQQAAQRET